MPTRNAEVHWQGGSRDGKGHIRLGSGAFEGSYSFSSRMENGAGTNPEELVCAALAGCFTMALASALERSGHPAHDLNTTASVELLKNANGYRLSAISLHTVGDVPGTDEAAFQKLANEAKRNCPLSVALEGVQIALEATLSNKAATAQMG
jgi:osmotically inducible protein OsmC